MERAENMLARSASEDPLLRSALPAPRSTFLPSDRTVRWLLAPAFVFIACCIDRNYQTDLWHHLARGKIIVEEGKILDEDRFTYTVPGKQFQDVNWLSQVIFYRLYQVGGLELLQVVNALMMSAVVAMLVWLAQRRSGSLLIACGVGLFAFIGLWQLILIRPQTIAFVLFVLLYAALELADEKPWLLVFAPLLLALWVNIHGSFPIGLVLIGCYLFAAVVDGWWKNGRAVMHDRRVWRLAVCLVVACLATLANPYGWRVYEYVGLTSGTAAARKIDEWLPPGLSQIVGKVWVASMLGMFVLFALPGKRPTIRQVCLVLCFLPPACGSVRMIAWWLFIIAPIAAELLAANLPTATIAPQEEDQPKLSAGIVCGLLLVGMVVSVPWLERWNPIFPRIRSPHRVEYDLQKIVDQIPRGSRVFTRFEWSEYLTWAAGPETKVFMDGRIEIFPNEVWEEYTAVTNGAESWERILDAFAVEYLLIDAGPYHARLRDVETRKWELVDKAGDVTLYRRKR